MRLRLTLRGRRLVVAATVVSALLCTATTGGDSGPRLSVRLPATTTTTLTRAGATTTTAPPATTRAAPVPATVAVAAPVSKPPPPLVAGPGVAIGDSVLEDVRLYAPATLQGHDIAINAAVGRQWAVGIRILTGLRSAGTLPSVVIVALGSNGRISDAQFDQMMQACAGAKRVVFMTVTGPLIGNNPIIAAGVARYPAAAVLADWNTTAATHGDWFAPDHVHIGPAGATALGNLLASLS